MLLDASDVTRRYVTAEGPLTVLDGVSVTLDAGETLALTGESGSGKSTLLHLLGGLDRPDSGRLLLDGVDLATQSESALAHLRRDRIGLVFQQFNLIPSLNAGANLEFQARLAGRLDTTWVTELAGTLGLSELLHRYPEELSGGQQQRVAIGRALAARPSLVLADEPTGNLDETTADAVVDLMVQLATAQSTALLMVTHSSRLATRLGRRLHLSAGRLAPLPAAGTAA